VGGVRSRCGQQAGELPVFGWAISDPQFTLRGCWCGVGAWKSADGGDWLLQVALHDAAARNGTHGFALAKLCMRARGAAALGVSLPR
jgi:hypothetical protein